MPGASESAIETERPNQGATYEQDVVAWAWEQARLLRAGRFELLDIEHIADEIEDVGKSEQRELANRMAVLLAHFLKWRFQEERRGRSWERTIRDQRAAIARRVKKMPSLKESLRDPEWWEDAWGDAVALAVKETGLDVTIFPDVRPWEADDILTPEWLPE